MTTPAPSLNLPVDGFDFLLWFAWLKEMCLVVVVLLDLVIHFFCKKFRCRTYLFNSVDEGVDNR